MKKYFLTIIIFFGLISCGQQNASVVAEQTKPPVADMNTHGRNLFLENCASCHAIKKELVGPPMAGVEQRWNDKAKLYAFVRNSSEVIKTDKYAHDLFMKYNQSMMLPFPNLSDADIDAILLYIKTQSK